MPPFPSLLANELMLAFLPILELASLKLDKLNAGPSNGLELILFSRPGDFVDAGLDVGVFVFNKDGVNGGVLANVDRDN